MTPAASEVSANRHPMSDRARRYPPPRVATGKAVGIGLGAVAVLTLVAVFAPSLFAGGLPGRAQDALTLTLTVLLGALPWVMLGVFLSIVVQVWLPSDAVQNWLPGNAWARRIVLSLMGIVVPVGEGGNITFARGMMMRGLAPADALTLIFAAPIMNPVVIITTQAAFGWDSGVLVARLVGGFVIANLIGWLFSLHPDPQGLLTARFAETAERVRDEPGSPSRRSLMQFLIELRAVLPPLVIGSALAGAVQLLVPRDVLVAIGANPVLAVFVMIALAMIIAVGSNVDAFVALSFASTFSTGALIAFLLVGPVADLKMIALLRTTFTTRVVVVVTALVVLAAAAIGIGVNVFG